MIKKVLIIGGTGQIGYYLANFLLKKKNIKIFISTRSKKSVKFKKFKNLLSSKINYVKIDISNKKKISSNLKKIRPDFIFFLAGQSSVYKSFYKKKETFISNFQGSKNVLDSIIENKLDPKFFNACSTEIFGNKKKKLKLSSSKNPVSPYGKAKLKSFNLMINYRKKFKLKIYNGILSNCESFMRPKTFVLPKICICAIKAKNNIKKNKVVKFKFGNINIKRDWGWAEEYVKVIWNEMKKNEHDFFIATRKSYHLRKLFFIAFSKFKLDWKQHIIIDKKFFRRKEINSVEIHTQSKSKEIKTDGKKIILKLLNHYNKLHFNSL